MGQEQLAKSFILSAEVEKRYVVPTEGFKWLSDQYGQIVIALTNGAFHRLPEDQSNTRLLKFGDVNRCAGQKFRFF